MFRGLHNWLIKIVRIVECVCEYCRQSSRWYLMFSRQLFIFLERSPDCFSVGASIINKAAWNQCYISLDNGRDDAATSQHHHGKWSLGPGSQQQVVPLVPVHPPPGVAGPGHASLHFLIYKMGREKLPSPSGIFQVMVVVVVVLNWPHRLLNLCQWTVVKL